MANFEAPIFPPDEDVLRLFVLRENPNRNPAPIDPEKLNTNSVNRLVETGFLRIEGEPRRLVATAEGCNYISRMDAYRHHLQLEASVSKLERDSRLAIAAIATLSMLLGIMVGLFVIPEMMGF